MSECIICNKPLKDEVYCFEELPISVTPVCPDCWLKLSKKYQPHLDSESVSVCSVCGKKLDYACQPADAICGSCVDNALSDEMDGDAVDEKKI